MLSNKTTINGGGAASSKAVYVNEASVSLILKRTNSSDDTPVSTKYKQDERKKRELANPVVQKLTADVGGNADIDFTSLPLETLQEIFTYCDVKELGDVSATRKNVKNMTASKLHVLKAWWSQLENVVNVMDEDAGIESDRRLFYNKVPLATWKNQDIFLSACIKMLGAMYNMTCSYMQDKNSFYVGATPGLAYMDPIKNACTANDLARVNILIDGGYDLNKTDRRGQNALYKAVDACCSIPLVGKILDNITDVNAHDDEGKTALMWATQYSEAEHVKLLMEYPNVDPNVQNRYGMTALHLAVTYNCVPTITELLNGENIDCTLLDCEGITPLQMAVDAVRPACEQLLRAHGAPMYGSYQHAFEADDEETEQSVNALLNMGRDPNEVDEHGRNVLHHAAWRGYSLPLFNRILENIADVNAVIDKDWRSALMLATRFHRVEFVTVLMNHPQIDLNVIGLVDRTVLHFAVLYADTAILELLCSDTRIDYTFEDSYGNTPLGMTTYYRHNREKCAQILRAHGAPFYGSYKRAFEANDEHTEQSVNALLDAGVDPNEVDGSGRNALHWAAWKGCRPPLFQRVVARIHDVNTVHNYGRTALILAAENNQLDVVMSLMNHPGIDLNVQDCSNGTALHYAVLYNHPAIVSQLLSDDKMDASLKDKNNNTALKRAIVKGYTECAQILKDYGASYMTRTLQKAGQL
jgi:ankyrin repeat protein